MFEVISAPLQRSRDKSPPTRKLNRRGLIIRDHVINYRLRERKLDRRGFEPHPYFLLGVEKSTMKLQLYVILLTAFAAFGGLMFGYDIG